MLNYKTFEEDIKKARELGKPCKIMVASEEEAATIVTWQEINDFLNSGQVDFPRVRLANSSNAEMLGYRGFLETRLTKSGYNLGRVRKKAFLDKIIRGSSIIIDRCMDYFPNTRTINDFAESALLGKASSNLYCSWSNSSSFGWHFDGHDVIAIQIQGSKKWSFKEPTFEYPTNSDKSFLMEVPQQETCFELRIEPGEAVYVPKGYWHVVETLTENSVHLTVGINKARNLDVLSIIEQELRRHAFFRMDLPDKISPEYVINFKEQLMASINEIDLDQAISRAKFESCLDLADAKINLPNLY
ncbi:hypothetical protein BGP77_06595 [Saccharospirillum sp. MSK14-1]|uniref:JmjC domain-containing protein n=1 Tax=Saccharospirillum sp. MSK14-1 TaxID=1897632 RepID=UPI000D3B878C|nr:cupin domain-containing protein [Saccharospirillum sp. MSK14-1]PTY36948.1 hypothetical protein BGP77_06595 [Saccharospirillum sp. MSK14-1]